MSIHRGTRNGNKSAKAPALTTILVLFVVVFIAIDVTISGGGTPEENTWYLLRIEMSSDVHDNLSGTLSFDVAEGIYEQIQSIDGIPTFTVKAYRGSFRLNFDGVGVTFGPIELSIYNIGTVFDAVVNEIQIKIDAIEG